MERKVIRLNLRAIQVYDRVERFETVAAAERFNIREVERIIDRNRKTPTGCRRDERC
ncbi:hypothetical protein D3C75_1052140 [compost metagenome]